MAQKKAYIDPRQSKGEKEAVNIVYDWFRRQGCNVDKNQLYSVWFAFIGYSSYKCMVTSHEYNNLFFEVTVNKKNGEIRCDCFKRFEYFVRPQGHTTDRSDSLDDIFSQF